MAQWEGRGGFAADWRAARQDDARLEQAFAGRRAPDASRFRLATNHGLIVEDAAPGGAVGGVKVTDIAPGSAADAAGLMPGDVITEVAGKPLKGKADFDAAINGADLTRGMMLMVDRDGQRTFAILKL